MKLDSNISRYIFVSFAIYFFFSCSVNLQEKKYEIIEVDSVFFEKIQNTTDYFKFSEFLLKYPESKLFEKAVENYYEKQDVYYSRFEFPRIECFRNCASIEIGVNDGVLFEYRNIELSELKDSLLSFLRNDKDLSFWPEKKDVKDLNGAWHSVSKGRVDLSYVKDSCDILQPVVVEISKAFSGYKNHLSLSWYGKDFVEISKFEKQHIDSLFQRRFLLYEMKERYVPSLPMKQ